MNLKPNAFSPMLTFLSETDRQKIYHAALQVLEHTGMTLQHDGAVKLLKDAGCRQDADGLITIPAALVEKAVDSAPANIPMFNRDGEHVMDLGGRRAYFGTGSDLMYHVDGKTLARTHTRLEHIARAARVCDALTNIDFIMSFAHPHDIDAQPGLCGKLCRHGSKLRQTHRQYGGQPRRPVGHVGDIQNSQGRRTPAA